MTVLVIVATVWTLVSLPLALATGRLIRAVHQDSLPDVPTALAWRSRPSPPIPAPVAYADDPTDVRGGVVRLPSP